MEGGNYINYYNNISDDTFHIFHIGSSTIAERITSPALIVKKKLNNPIDIEFHKLCKKNSLLMRSGRKGKRSKAGNEDSKVEFVFWFYLI